jgi:SAM-dependent methyltransferase
LIAKKSFGFGDGSSCWCGRTEHTRVVGEWRNVPGTTYALGSCDSCNTVRTIDCSFEEYGEFLYRFEKISTRHINSISTINKYCRGDLLDIGCNCGEIIKELSKNGNFSSLTGIDFSAAAVSHGRDKFDLRLKESTIDDIISEKEKYDTVIMIHTFEHISDPLEFLGKIKSVVGGERLLYLCVPNIEGAYLPSFGALDPREHYWHFTEDTLRRLVTRAYGDGNVLFSGKSSIWGGKEQLEMVISVPPRGE